MTEGNNTYQFIQKLAAREGVSEEKIKEIFISSFRRSYCQGENSQAELHFEFNNGLSVYRSYKIVETVNDGEKEITKSNDRLQKGIIKDGAFFLPLDTKNFSFSLNYEIKKQLRKDLGEINWEKQYKLYKSLQGQLVYGSIQSSQGNYYLVNLGKSVGYWGKKEWVLPESPRLGKRFGFLVKEVKENTEKGTPQIILTRNDDLLLHKLFETNIPQIKREEIIIRDILRIPGVVSKVVVESKKWGLPDPRGACIGEGGERIKTISQLIYPERVEVAAWSENKKELFFNLLSPVKVLQLTIKKSGEWEVVVPQQKASLLLQREGTMLKKISEYLEVNIHAVILEEIEKGKILENKGQILQEVGSYKNVKVQIVEDIDKTQ